MLKKAMFWLALLAMLALPLAAAEVLLRALGLGSPILYRTDAAYRFSPVPEQHVVRMGGARITIDSAGLRSLRDWNQPAAQRILFVGDSLTWAGTGIDDADTFAERVCADLSATGVAAITCGNAGVNAYGTDNMAARLRYDPVVAQANAVVVTVLAGDTERGLMDLRANYFFSRAPFGPLKAVWEAVTFAFFRAAYELRVSLDAHDTRYDVAVAERSLDGLYAELRRLTARGVPVLLVYSPHEIELTGEDVPLVPTVRAHLRASGLPFLDLTEAMRPLLGRGLYSDGVHLTAEGHALYGQWIAEALQRQGVGGAR